MSHRHKVDRSLLVLTPHRASYILGKVISVLLISPWLPQDCYHIHFKQTIVDTGEEKAIEHCECPRINFTHSFSIPTPFTMQYPIPSPIPFLWPIVWPFPYKSRPFSRPFPIPITSLFLSPLLIVSHHCLLLQEGGIYSGFGDTLCEHLSSWYVAQVDLTISTLICCEIILDCNMYNCSSKVDSLLDPRNW